MIYNHVHNWRSMLKNKKETWGKVPRNQSLINGVCTRIGRGSSSEDQWGLDGAKGDGVGRQECEPKAVKTIGAWLIGEPVQVIDTANKNVAFMSIQSIQWPLERSRRLIPHQWNERERAKTSPEKHYCERVGLRLVGLERGRMLCAFDVTVRLEDTHKLTRESG